VLFRSLNSAVTIGKSRMGLGFDLDLNNVVYRVNYTVFELHSFSEKERRENAVKVRLDSPDISEAGKIALILQTPDMDSRIENTLGRSLTPFYVKEIMAQGRVLYGGIKQIMSIMSVSVHDFMKIAESMLREQDLFALLNSHYEYVVDSVYESGGVLERFVGEQAISVFGIPNRSSDDAIRAVSAAVSIKNGIDVLNKKNSRITTPTGGSFPNLKLGVGISTGTTYYGGVGTARRSELSLIGEHVQMAARLQQATKIFGIPIIICEPTMKEVADHFQLRELDIIQLRNKDVKPGEKSATMSIYQVIGPTEMECTQEISTALMCYDLGLGEYRARNWPAAITQFRKAIQLIGDLPSMAMSERCKGILDRRYDAPDASWDYSWKYAAI